MDAERRRLESLHVLEGTLMTQSRDAMKALNEQLLSKTQGDTATVLAEARECMRETHGAFEMERQTAQ